VLLSGTKFGTNLCHRSSAQVGKDEGNKEIGSYWQCVNINSLTGAGAFSRLDDASHSLALARFSALIHSSLLCCLGTHQPKTYL
jgi:hypothetical protein